MSRYSRHQDCMRYAGRRDRRESPTSSRLSTSRTPPRGFSSGPETSTQRQWNLESSASSKCIGNVSAERSYPTSAAHTLGGVADHCRAVELLPDRQGCPCSIQAGGGVQPRLQEALVGHRAPRPGATSCTGASATVSSTNARPSRNRARAPKTVAARARAARPARRRPVSDL